MCNVTTHSSSVTTPGYSSAVAAWTRTNQEVMGSTPRAGLNWAALVCPLLLPVSFLWDVVSYWALIIRSPGSYLVLQTIYKTDVNPR